MQRIITSAGILLALAATALFATTAHAGLGIDEVTVGTARVALQSAQVRSVSVTMTISNSEPLAAAVVPLRYGHRGDGIELTEVRWSEVVEDFDLTIANVNNEEKTALLVLMPIATDPNKQDLPSGTYEIANLVFSVTDPTRDNLILETNHTDVRHPKPVWVYNDWSTGRPKVRWIEPRFDEVTLELGTAGVQVPREFALHQNYPNPFNPATTISYSLPQPAQVELIIFNVLGQHVRTLVNEHQDAGNYDVTWDATNDSKNPVSSGVYFYRIHMADHVATRKMSLLR